jgi:splicing factor 3B subunit 3
MVESVADEDKAAVAQVAAEFLQEDLPEQQFGAAKAGPGMWASVIRVFDPIKVCSCSNGRCAR